MCNVDNIYRRKTSHFQLILIRFSFEEGRPDSNFDSFPSAILTVFQVKMYVYRRASTSYQNLAHDSSLVNCLEVFYMSFACHGL